MLQPLLSGKGTGDRRAFLLGAIRANFFCVEQKVKMTRLLFCIIQNCVVIICSALEAVNDAGKEVSRRNLHQR